MVFTGGPKVPNKERWKMIFPRVLYQSGIPPEEIDAFASDEDIEYMVDQYLYALKPRPGLAEMLQTLKEGGIEFWCCSGASVDRVKNYFDRAGIEMPRERIWDVTPVGVHKPNLAVYKALMAEWQEKKPGEVMIFGGEWRRPSVRPIRPSHV
jgi:2-haloacid dehalogenase